jgi:hypothetical protein
LVTSVVEDLNVNNILFADRIVAQISTSFSERSPFPKVSFLGTAFEGLRIGNLEVRPVFNLGLLDGGERGKYPTVSYLDDRDFHERVGVQTSRFSEFLEELPREEQVHHEWAQDYANADTNTHEEILRRGNVLCSLVEGFEETEASRPGTQIGHAIHIPDFGRILLAELIVGHHSFDLTMLRLELGCPVSGTASAAQASSSGTPVAPRGSGGGSHTNAVPGNGTATSSTSPRTGAEASAKVANAPASGTLPRLQAAGAVRAAYNVPPGVASTATPAPVNSPVAPRGSGGGTHTG